MDKPFYYPAANDFKKYIKSAEAVQQLDTKYVFSDAYSFLIKEKNVLVIISKNIDVPENIPKYFLFKKLALSLKVPIVSKEDYSLYTFNKDIFFQSLEPLIITNFENFLEKWKPLNQCKFVKDKKYPNKIVLKTEGNNPYFESNFPLKVKEPAFLECRIQFSINGNFRVYYSKLNENYTQAKAVEYPVKEGLNNIIVRFPDNIVFEKIRIDPIDENKDCIIEEITLFVLKK